MQSNMLYTDSNDASDVGMYQKENKEIEYVNKQYGGSGWCCTQKESEIHPDKNPEKLRTMPPRERNPSVGERIADFFGWQSTAPAEENGVINEDSREDVDSQSALTNN